MDVDSWDNFVDNWGVSSYPHFYTLVIHRLIHRN
ncbi:hypothetical protein Za10_1177 [Zymomonas mobilis subsp. mobilis NCIMB 11163]|nr:hypothetical protein Za10_1177 [Zymomonas mobilis subsp. mobilis NCIMB 11163]TWD60361.1 hypothetical protein FBY50_1180 [Zymomonas mobilis]